MVGSRVVITVLAFLGYIVGMAARPVSTTRRLLVEPNRLRHGVFACLLLGTLYTVSVFIGFLNGFGAVVEPILPIPPSEYYLWETFFTIPVFFAILVTAGAVTQFISHGLQGTGAFKDTFSVLSLGITLPTILLLWIPETLVLVFLPHLRAQQLGGFSFMPGWLDAVRQIIVPVWAAVVWIKAVSVTQRFTVLRGALAVLAGLVPAALLAAVFVR